MSKMMASYDPPALRHLRAEARRICHRMCAEDTETLGKVYGSLVQREYQREIAPILAMKVRVLRYAQYQLFIPRAGALAQCQYVLTADQKAAMASLDELIDSIGERYGLAAVSRVRSGQSPVPGDELPDQAIPTHHAQGQEEQSEPRTEQRDIGQDQQQRVLDLNRKPGPAHHGDAQQARLHGRPGRGEQPADDGKE